MDLWRRLGSTYELIMPMRSPKKPVQKDLSKKGRVIYPRVFYSVLRASFVYTVKPLTSTDNTV